ncbi:hypothetical protein EI94DRAFT_562543 [Lactarius quietus]|nr:hypothetical protein EI94DRAFT_562543 [Lactarius quietus]
MNVNHWVSAQEYPDPNDMHLHLHHHPEPFTNVSLFELAPLLSSPASTSTSHSPHLSSSKSSPGPSRLSTDETPSMLHSEPQMESPASSQPAETPVRRPGPRRPSSSPALLTKDPHTITGPDTVGRRAPKPRRISRAVQPLACFFCRGRKIACGPPVNLGTGDRTCEYVAIRPFNSVRLFTHTIMCAPRARSRGASRAPSPFHIWSACSQVLSGADFLWFLYWLDPAHGAVSSVNILQSHIVAAVPRGQKRPPGNHSDVERIRWLTSLGMCYIHSTVF